MFELAEQHLHHAPQLEKVILKFTQSEAQRFDFLTLFLNSLTKTRLCGESPVKVFAKCIEGEHCVVIDMHVMFKIKF